MADNGSDKAQKLGTACGDAYAQYPHSCSHAVWHVVKQYVPAQPYMTANNLVQSLRTSSRWQEVRLFELSKLASDGVLVVGGATDSPNGHVIVVYPGKEKFSGGYFFKDKVTGKDVKAPPNGIHALAMSTSMGNWPGAKSQGDKTVLDPWGSVKFKNVKFWKYVGD